MTRRNGQPSAIQVIPSARRLIGSLRDLGYEFPQAVADLVDNSVTAGARNVEIALEFAKTRVQGGKTIIEHPTVAHQLGEMASLIEAARAVSIQAAWMADQPDYDSQRGLLASIFASDVGPKVCNLALQLLGGHGYMREMGLEKILRDALMCYHIDGTSDMHRVKIGEMLSGVSTGGYISE